MSFTITQTSLTARSSSAFTSSIRTNKTRMASRHSSVSVVTKCEGPSAKNLEIMRKFSEQYARSSGTKFCMDKSVTAVVIQGTFFLYIVNNLLFVIFPPIAFFFCVCGRICKRETSPSMFKKRKKSFPRAGTVFDPLAKTSET